MQSGFSVVIPTSLSSGKYLIRHEVVYFYPADVQSPEVFPAGHELYSSCAQLDVASKGTAQPDSDELVSFPGAYKEDDPGLVYYDDFPKVSIKWKEGCSRD